MLYKTLLFRWGTKTNETAEKPPPKKKKVGVPSIKFDRQPRKWEAKRAFWAGTNKGGGSGGGKGPEGGWPGTGEREQIGKNLLMEGQGCRERPKKYHANGRPALAPLKRVKKIRNMPGQRGGGGNGWSNRSCQEPGKKGIRKKRDSLTTQGKFSQGGRGKEGVPLGRKALHRQQSASHAKSGRK